MLPAGETPLVGRMLKKALIWKELLPSVARVIWRRRLRINDNARCVKEPGVNLGREFKLLAQHEKPFQIIGRVDNLFHLFTLIGLPAPGHLQGVPDGKGGTRR